MKKGVFGIACISLAIILISTGFVSAGWWSDFLDLFGGEEDGSETGALYTGATGDLIVHYSFENNIVDSQGGHDGVAHGITYTDGKIGKAGSFDGVNNFVAVADNADLKSETFSVSAWVYPKTLPLDHRGILQKDWASNKGYSLTIKNGHPYFYVGGEGYDWKSAKSVSSVNVNEWVHIIGTFDGSIAKIYVNGDLEGSVETSYVSNTWVFRIGHVKWTSDEESYFDGLIDEVKYWNYELSESEIADEYDLTSICTPNCTGKVCGADDGCGSPCQTGSCPEGEVCQSGTCIDEGEVNCTDSDGGLDYDVKGTASKSGWNDTEDFCVNTIKLSEALCNNDNNPAYAQYDCLNGCSEGKCNSAPTCTDTDNGIKYYISGTTTDNTGSNSDTCSGKNLTEFYCNSTVKQSVAYECPDTCESGICVREETVEVLANSFQFDASLIELEELTKVLEHISVLPEHNESVPDNRTITVVKPDDSTLSMLLLKRDSSLECNNNSREMLCYVSYEKQYTPPVTGIYFIQEDLVGSGGLKVVPVNYSKENLVLVESSLYTFDYQGYYDAIDDKEILHVNYDPVGAPEGEDYWFKIYRFNSEDEASLLLDEFLAEISEENLLSSLQSVTDNLIYIFKNPLYNGNVALWKSGNDVVAVEIDEGGERDDDQTIEDFILGLSGTLKKQVISSDYNTLPELSRTLIEQYIALYPSDINGTECISNWECVTAPTLCPEYGKQVKTCTDTSECAKEDIVIEIPCQPGICSGCMLPVNEFGISQCAPFGFRLMLDNQNKYCDVDGQVKVQKAVEGSCQNNYECESNTCSDRVCVGLVEEIREQTNLLKRIWCWITNLFDKTARDACLGGI